MNAELKSGSLLKDGLYKILKSIKREADSLTYTAVQTDNHTRVTIREFFPLMSVANYGDDDRPMLDPGGATGHEFRQFQLSVGRKIAALNHPNLVPIYDTFTQNNAVYWVMPVIALPSWAERQETMPNRQVPLLKLEKWAGQLVQALDLLHKVGISPAGLSPDKVYIDDEDHLIFGSLGSTKHLSAMQQVTTAVERFDAPEIVYGELAGPWSDLYSMGVMLQEATTGVKMANAAARRDQAFRLEAGLSTKWQRRLSIALSLDPQIRQMGIREWWSPGVEDIHHSPLPRKHITTPDRETGVPPSAVQVVESGNSGRKNLLWSAAAVIVIAIAVILIRGAYDLVNNSGQSRLSSYPLEDATTSNSPPATIARSGQPQPATPAQQIDQLVLEGNRYVASGKLTSPPGANALDNVKRIRILDPDNVAAVVLQQKISLTYEGWGDRQAELHNYEKAELYFNKSLEIWEHGQIRDKIANVRQTAAAAASSANVLELEKKATEALFNDDYSSAYKYAIMAKEAGPDRPRSSLVLAYILLVDSSWRQKFGTSFNESARWNLARVNLLVGIGRNNNPDSGQYLENGIWSALLISALRDKTGDSSELRHVVMRCYVRDAGDSQPLTGANISFPGTRFGISLGQKGEFLLPRLERKYSVKITFLGFETLILDGIDLSNPYMDTIIISLKSTAVQTPPIRISFDPKRSVY